MKRSDDMDQELWQAFRLAAASLSRNDHQALVCLARQLGPRWGRNGPAMRRVLQAGIEAGELDVEVLDRWDRQWAAGSPGEHCAPLVAQDDAAPLPLRLQQCEQAIGEGTRQHGKGALMIGRSLILAQHSCAEHGWRFEDFLNRLNQSYQLHRATCFLYIKLAEWNFPSGLSVSVMKWIVQGFDRGSDLAMMVIRAAAEQSVGLAELKTRFGGLRKLSQPVSHTFSPKAELAPLELLLVEQAQLSARRSQIELRLLSIEADLKSRKRSN